MPELPEVETIVRSLQPLVGQKVLQMEIFNNTVMHKEDFSAADLKGKKIKEILRRGKYIILKMGKGRAIVVHLGMSGRFYRADAGTPMVRHTHVVIYLQDGVELRFTDPRRFGGIWLTREPESVVSLLGPEPLGEDFDCEYLGAKCRNRRVAIKTLVLKQDLIAGIGNIYADEILHRAGIQPGRPAGSLSSAEIQTLYDSVVHTLQMGIDNRGTTFRDYRDGMNLPGNFQHQLQVYGKTGQPCPICGQPICRDTIGGRSSHYCSRCQI